MFSSSILNDSRAQFSGTNKSRSQGGGVQSMTVPQLCGTPIHGVTESTLIALRKSRLNIFARLLSSFVDPPVVLVVNHPVWDIVEVIDGASAFQLFHELTIRFDLLFAYTPCAYTLPATGKLDATDIAQGFYFAHITFRPTLRNPICRRRDARLQPS